MTFKLKWGWDLKQWGEIRFNDAVKNNSKYLTCCVCTQSQLDGGTACVATDLEKKLLHVFGFGLETEVKEPPAVQLDSCFVIGL